MRREGEYGALWLRAAVPVGVETRPLYLWEPTLDRRCLRFRPKGRLYPQQLSLAEKAREDRTRSGVGRNNRIGMSCSQFINVVQSAKHRSGNDFSSLVAGYRLSWLAGGALPDRSVRTPMIEINHVLAQDPA